MEVILYQNKYNTNESIESFIDLLYCSKMNYLASDLLHVGLSSSDIQDAINRALIVSINSDVKIRKHFAPMYTQVDGQVFRDCKLSEVGYSLVLLNARPDLKATGKWQMKVIANMLKLDY